jgi:hypothetical protein
MSGWKREKDDTRIIKEGLAFEKRKPFSGDMLAR